MPGGSVSAPRLLRPGEWHGVSDRTGCAPVSPEEASQVMPWALACWAMARKDAGCTLRRGAKTHAEDRGHILIDG